LRRKFRVAWSLAADFRRARIYLLRTVFRYQKAGLSCQERSPISPVTFMPGDAGEYIRFQKNPSDFSTPRNRESADERNLLWVKVNRGAQFGG
jgi:hypothetical protein